MRPYFESPEACAALIASLKKNEGRPFRHTQNGTPGGFNCWHLTLEAYTAAGLDTSSMRGAPVGGLNHGKFHKESRILQYLHTDPVCRKHVRRLDPTEPIMTGDFLAVREALSSHHLGIAESADVAWQVPRGGSVGRISMRVIRPYIHSIYRIYV